MGQASDLQRQMFDAVSRGDMKVVRDLCHPGYRYTGQDGVEGVGVDAGVAVAELYSTAFPDLAFETLRTHEHDGVSVAELRFTGTHTGPLDTIPPTGRAVEGVLCNVVEVRDGRLWRERDYLDELSLLRQLGLAED